ncbi:hypothetical protein [Pseudomonas sp. BN102]|uniref:hypothetical protein n=1 Tax=Pseudomonas sp. BN102 TaxID=2567886 RepID=UPI0024581505|nr:hypothetical protein [Pseudomonas sp. BN102]MDH4611163.1 hypothetical protein [Pseudomonas sp. BN102]
MSIACIDPALMITELLLVIHATAEAASTAQALLFHYIYIEEPVPCPAHPAWHRRSDYSLELRPREYLAARRARQDASIING